MPCILCISTLCYSPYCAGSKRAAKNILLATRIKRHGYSWNSRCVRPEPRRLTSYADRLKHYFIANGVTDDDKKRAILISASGPATYKLLRSLVGATRLGTDKYDDLVKNAEGPLRSATIVHGRVIQVQPQRQSTRIRCAVPRCIEGSI